MVYDVFFVSVITWCIFVSVYLCLFISVCLWVVCVCFTVSVYPCVCVCLCVCVSVCKSVWTEGESFPLMITLRNFYLLYLFICHVVSEEYSSIWDRFSQQETAGKVMYFDLWFCLHILAFVFPTVDGFVNVSVKYQASKESTTSKCSDMNVVNILKVISLTSVSYEKGWFRIRVSANTWTLIWTSR